MLTFPLIVRELRAESRRPANYWLRLLAAGSVLLVFTVLVFNREVRVAEIGALLFGYLHRTLLWAFWITIPLMTADCISKEKREGTLDLLFLTPLRVLDVILGKAAIHGIRATTLLLAALPILGLPFVLGGVGWAQALWSLAELGNAVLLAIGAAICASSKGGTAVQVMVRAELYALGLFAFQSILFLILELATLGSGTPRPVLFACAYGLGLASSAIVFGVLLRISENLLKANWQRQTAAPEQPRWVEIFDKDPFFQSAFRWDKSRTLDRNPIAWLQEYSWTARLTKWGWFIVVLPVELILVVNWDANKFPGWQPIITGAVSLGVAFSAVWSFRRENESGLLELLLTTPVTAQQLIRGRLWGIFCHYLPALGALLVGWEGDRLLNPKAYSGGLLTWLAPNPLTFVSMMVVGLQLSLGRLNFLQAWILTWAVAYLVPAIMTIGLGDLYGATRSAAIAIPSVFLVLIVGLTWTLLQRKFRLRTFVIR
jgi:ABC-type transport system involved in cytochrome c biogenesis permease component